jgi:phospholipid/cholesterol/gamma-HCH transport system substrate-binding protein
MSRVTRQPPPSPQRLRAIGIAVVAGAILLAVVAYVKPNPFAGELTVRANFKNAATIGVSGAEVRMAGARVGEVTDVERAGDSAIVVMGIDPDAGPIGRDASARLRPRTAFEGAAFIELDPGSAGSGKLGDRVIPQARAYNFVALDEALRFAVPDVRKAISSDVASLSRILRPEGQEGLRRTLGGAPALTRRLAVGARAARGRTRTELRGAVEGFADTVAAVAREQESLTPLLHGARRTVAALKADGGAPLDRSLRRLPGALADLDGGGRALIGLVDRVEVVGGELRPGLRALKPALDDLTPLVRSARPVLTRAQPFLHDLRSGLHAGGTGSPAASRLLRALDPSLTLLDSSLLPALEKPTGLGLPSYLQFISMFQGGAGAFRPFTKGPTTPLLNSGPGHFTRFSARFFTGIGAPLAPCSSIGRISTEAEALLSRTNLCNP